jgi:hypothetical protein
MIRASEAPDAGSIPAEATFSRKLIIVKKTKNLPNAVLVGLSYFLILFIRFDSF